MNITKNEAMREFQKWWTTQSAGIAASVPDDLYAEIKALAYRAWRASATAHMKMTLHCLVDTLEERR
jgi:hypothetical protein